eukprot:Rhum_TRINITY_DN15187_c4_g1::Rhum_TRINITY_DN15187_c4_g1_i1::g.142692::m.142692/K20295/COG8; conserved oligomeric Golgi complex subunit 8
MESFLREPSRLAAEQRRLLSDMVDVSVKHYPVFMQSTEACSDVLRRVAKDVQTSERLQAEEEELRRCLKRLMEKGQEWKKGRQQLLMLRSNQDLIRDVFELPALMDNCLRQELYYECVTLHDKAEEIVAAAPNVPVVKMIAGEVEALMHKNLPQLILRLSTALSPAQCLKITRFVTRLKLISNRDLRKLFLSRRLVYLQSLLRDAHRSPFTYLNRVCNVLGVNLLAVITEYNSSFEESTGTLSREDVDCDTPACDILGAWMCSVVDAQIEAIRASLQHITSGGELKQLLEQAIQCGKQLASKGVDVRPILVKIFSDRILELWSQGLAGGYSSFRLCLGNHVWIKHTEHAREHKYDRVGGSMAPPQVLRQYLPLGYLCNGVLAAFNEYRRCALVSLTPQIHLTLSELLAKCVSDIVAVYANQLLDATETEGFLSFVKVTTDDLLPFIARSCDIMLGTTRTLAIREIAAPLTEIYRQHVKVPTYVPPAPAAAAAAASTTEGEAAAATTTEGAADAGAEAAPALPSAGAADAEAVAGAEQPAAAPSGEGGVVPVEQAVVATAAPVAEQAPAAVVEGGDAGGGAWNAADDDIDMEDGGEL